MKQMMFAALLMLGLNAQAGEIKILSLAQSLTSNIRPESLLNWNVGDSADYKLSGGMLQGTMHMFVREATAQGFWLQQDLDLGMFGQNKVEVLLDKDNGKVIEMIVNGQKQTPPADAENEVIDSRRESVTVPKGTFDCMWIKLHDKKQNTDTQVWINPTIVPIMGMLKTIQPSQMGDVTLELTDFVRR